jgi:methylphosphotriester-DNA--protein-cysteine methyltransferase
MYQSKLAGSTAGALPEYRTNDAQAPHECRTNTAEMPEKHRRTRCWTACRRPRIFPLDREPDRVPHPTVRRRGWRRARKRTPAGIIMRIERYVPPPTHQLHRRLQCVFHARSDHRRELVLPKCNVDLLFNLGDPIVVESTDASRSHVTWRHTLVAGLQTRAFVARPQGRVEILGISLQPMVSGLISKASPDELRERVVDGADLEPELLDPWDRLAETRDFARRCRIVLDWLSARAVPAAGSPLVRHSCNLLERRPVQGSLDTILRSSGVTPRHLRRLFRQEVGVGPARYLRLARFSRALRLMQASGSLAQVAHDAEYFDQAHFCREFRDISGMAAGAYRQRAESSSGHVFSR